jgi:hypothetical protein
MIVPAVTEAAGIDVIARSFDAHLPIRGLRIGIALTLSVGTFVLPSQVKNGGYEELVRDVMARVSNIPRIWLKSSHSIGEGSLVAAVALQKTRPKSYVAACEENPGGWGHVLVQHAGSL